MAMLRFQHRNLRAVETFAYEVVDFLQARVKKRGSRCSVLGPSEAPLSRLKNLYRWQCLVKSESVKDLQGILRELQEFAAQRKSTVRLDVDVDPVNSM